MWASKLKRCNSTSFKCLASVMLLLTIRIPVFAQETPKEAINKIMAVVNQHTKNRSAEKLYLQTNKPNYLTGDTLWFKAYLLEAPYLHAAVKSGVLYIELANDSNKVIKRTMLPVHNGLAFGNIALNEREMPIGGYTLRAYTNWMRNNGENDVFKKHFYLSQASNRDWLVNYKLNTVKKEDKETVQLNMRFKQVDMVPVAVREMQLKLTDGKRKLLNGKADTDVDGVLAVNFDLPGKADPKNLSLTVQDLRKGAGNRHLTLPLALNRPDKIDLQFMPEGGSLVAGLPARIAFKAIKEDGYGTEISGVIYNSRQQQVAVFSSVHKGIGVFDMLPQTGEVYSAKIKLTDGSYKIYPLPEVKNSGITLRVNNLFNSDSIEVLISATGDIASRNYPCYLIGHARGVVCYGALVHFEGVSKFVIPKNVFPTGVACLTLTVPDKIALNDRMIFIDHQDNLRIQVTGNKELYGQRDSVALQVKVTNADGDPVRGSFSLAVTDDGQVKTDSLANASIISYMLLNANLKGFVEDPGYYYSGVTNAQKWSDTDQLLLAQGWAGYNWDDAFLPPKPLAYVAENNFFVTGRVTNMFNKPVANTGVTLFSRRPLIITDTVTSTKGIFTFNGIYPADTAVYFIQAKNIKGKSANVGIELDEFKPPVFSAVKERLTPWFVNTDTVTLISIKKQASLMEDRQRLMSGTVLKEVVIKGKKIIKESQNLNGSGQADQVIDEAELQKAGRMNLGTLLEQRVKGFGVRYDKSGRRYYGVNTMLVHLIIDGVDTDFFRMEGTPIYEHLKYYFDYYDAEEIKGIEIMKGSGYAMSYTTRFLKPTDIFFANTFIEVTTRSGNGPFMQKAVGTYVYRPIPFNIPVAFYSPKYKVDATPDMTDIRSTIYWAPNVITDKNGNATISFYTGDNPGNYTFILEGTDLQGGLSVKRGLIKVSKEN